MKVHTSRFGALEVNDTDIISLAEGLMGFEDLNRYFIVDPSDDTMILWFQSMDRPEIAFPILEPKIFRPDYRVRLSANELRLLKLDSVAKPETLVYSILTIPEDPRGMTANLKAPIVVNVKENIARQVVLQENEYSVKCSMYKELLTLIMSVPREPNMEKQSEMVAAAAVAPKLANSSVEVSPL